MFTTRRVFLILLAALLIASASLAQVYVKVGRVSVPSGHIN